VGEYDSTGTLTAENIFGADGLLSRYTPSGGRIFYSFDLRGAVAERLYANGASYQVDQYDAYGYRSERLLDYSDPWGFGAQAGYYTDLETGLLLLTHRFYDPATGRFLTRDPLGYGGGINLYGYCQNDPVNRIDPRGLWSVTISVGVIGIIPGLGGGADAGIVIGDQGIAGTADWYAGSGSGLGASVGPSIGFSGSPQSAHGGQSGFGIVTGFDAEGAGISGAGTYSPGGGCGISGWRGGPGAGAGGGWIIGAGNSYTSDPIPWTNPFAGMPGTPWGPPLPSNPYSSPVGPGMPGNGGPGPGDPGSEIPM